MTIRFSCELVDLISAHILSGDMSRVSLEEILNISPSRFVCSLDSSLCDGLFPAGTVTFVPRTAVDFRANSFAGHALGGLLSFSCTLQSPRYCLILLGFDD